MSLLLLQHVCESALLSAPQRAPPPPPTPPLLLVPHLSIILAGCQQTCPLHCSPLK